MPRTTKKPAKPKPAMVNGPIEIGDVFTLAEVAAYLRLTEESVLIAVSSQELPGRLVAGEWRFLKSAVQQWLAVSKPTSEMRRLAQLAAAGSLKDDGAEWVPASAWQPGHRVGEPSVANAAGRWE